MGGGETSTTTESRLSDELRSSSLAGLEGAENLYNQGTEGIYQGSRLAEEDPLLRQAQENLLAQYGEGGSLSNLVNTAQANFGNYLNAGDLENNPLFQRQMEGRPCWERFRHLHHTSTTILCFGKICSLSPAHIYLAIIHNDLWKYW